jgi:hypothetical protein
MGYNLKKDLRGRFRYNTRGFIKRRNILENLICYCFEYTAKDIEKDYIENNKSLIMEKIITEKKFGSCRCAEKNPKGK